MKCLRGGSFLVKNPSTLLKINFFKEVFRKDFENISFRVLIKKLCIESMLSFGEYLSMAAFIGRTSIRNYYPSRSGPVNYF